VIKCTFASKAFEISAAVEDSKIQKWKANGVLVPFGGFGLYKLGSSDLTANKMHAVLWSSVGAKS
jgi:hypothetical protein